MIDIAKVKVGDKVHYQPSHYAKGIVSNGMVKEIPEHTNLMIRVVFSCNGEWDKFKDYTAQLTPIRDLYLGWKH